MRRVGIVVALIGLAAPVLVPIAPSAPSTFSVSTSASPIAVPPSEMAGAVPVTLTIHNDGDEADVLLGGGTPLADRVEIHATRLIDGQREMQPEPGGIVIPPGATLVLEPGADHVMLIGLREALVQGDDFPLTLHFAQAGEVTVQVRVRRKVDAAGLTPVPPVTIGDLTVSLASAPPAAGAGSRPSASPIAMR